ncbi:MAG: PKD domain-containing protein [Bacteroidetes bacterium]|nr:PKD domain-containing protein [Bacteroidota bacterium]
MKKLFPFLLILFFAALAQVEAEAQCSIMEPGFKFLTSSRGCAPYTVSLETLYLFAIPGTTYYVDWGDGTPQQTYLQSNATGVIMTHTYPSASINCGYDVVIDASNACNPQGSVVPINTQVIVWTNDVVSISPQVFRVCQGFAETLSFTDNSTWNCFPRATRENSAPRWIQWVYGTGPLASQIPGVQVNGILPGGYPYLNPAANTNPIYPVAAPGQLSLPLNIPVTAPANVGNTFQVTLKNWNQCNAYSNDPMNPLTPMNGDFVNGDNPAQIATAQVVIVPSPQPSFITRLNNAGGPVKTTFCIGDAIFFDDQTPFIAGSAFGYTWQFFDNNTGAGAPLATSTSNAPIFSYSTGGQKLIRLSITDTNAAGGCTNTYDGLITISPSLVAQIQTTDLSNNIITPNFCQNAAAPYTTFQVRFKDVSAGVATPSTQWQWQFYNQSNVLVSSFPASGFSKLPLGPYDRSFTTRGIYRATLTIRDSITGCQTQNTAQVLIYENPVPSFTATRACQGQLNTFAETSTLNAINADTIALREWDFNYNGVTFNKDPAYDNKRNFSRSLGVAGTYQVALRVTASQNSCSAILIVPVTVDPLPLASFAPDKTSGCSVLRVNFTNTSIAGQPDVVDHYNWEIDFKQGLGFQVVATQRPADPGFSSLFSYSFKNTTTANTQADVRLHVYSAHGCEAISPVTTITVFPGTNSGFSSTNYSPFNNNCSPQTINFQVDAATQALSPSGYTWTVSDANGIIATTGTGTTPTFNYTFSNLTLALKDFSVKLTTTLATGCFGDSTRTIRIAPVPSSLFTLDTLAYNCNEMTVNLHALQKGLAAYHWVIVANGVTLSDATGTADQFQFTFNRTAVAQAVQFSLDTKNFANCVSPVLSSAITVPPQDNMNASFTVTPLSQTLPASTVTITNTTNSGSWTYLWDFGDGTTATNANVPTHTYATYGVYTIKLTVTHNVCTQSVSHTVTILPIPPVVDFSYDPSSGCEPLTVNFTNLSQYALPNTYQWDFGDGNSSTAINPVHIYSAFGTYSVSLSASNSTGQIISTTKQKIIQVYARPFANFVARPAVLYIPGGTLSTLNMSRYATRYWWDFGDGDNSIEVNPEHIYKTEGSYTITLIAGNEHGCADTLSQKNTVIVKKANQVLIPNAFSPSPNGPGSGNGQNDIFLPLMNGVVRFEMIIFNRWGQLLFETTSPTQGWDGYYQGKLCEQDVYMYKLTALLENGETLVRTGDINLIR